MNSLLWAIGICVLTAAIEGLCAGRAPMEQLKAIRQPRWSPPTFVWILAGLAWDGICLTALARLLPAYNAHASTVWRDVT